MAQLVFIGGVSGVGKTTLLARLPRKEVRTVSASDLIKRARRAASLPTRDTETVMSYQDSLIDEYQRMADEDDRAVIMDGHFSIPTDDGFAILPVTVFRALAPAQFVLVEAPPETIAARLARRGTRRVPAIARIAEELAIERSAARTISSELQVPLAEIDSQVDATARLRSVLVDIAVLGGGQ